MAVVDLINELREELSSLYADISRYGGRPTQSQIDRTGALEVLLAEADKEFQGMR